MGFARRPPTARELRDMERMMERGDGGGRLWPGDRAHLRSRLLRGDGGDHRASPAARRRGRGFYASHIRGEGATLLDAVARGDPRRPRGRAARPGEPHQGGRTPQLGQGRRRAGPDRRRARRRGWTSWRDVYPYTASSTSLRTSLPDWALEGGVEGMLKRLGGPGGARAHPRRARCGEQRRACTRGIGWEDIMIAWSPEAPGRRGPALSEIAAARGVDPLDAAFELLVAEPARGR